MNEHSMGNDYKILCTEANDILKKPKGTMTSNGWTKVDAQHDRKSNFKGVLYEKDGQYAICFVGTDKFSIKDHGANLKMGLTGTNKQIELANKFTEVMQNQYGLNPKNTVSIGHSEGGTEATVAGLKHELPTRTFNAYGVWEKKYDPDGKADDLVINYRDPHDPVSKMHKNVGKTYIVPSTQNKFMRSTPFGSIPAHRIDSMGNCNDAVDVKEYKKFNPMFLDNISEADLSGDDIGKMDSELFMVYEPEINKRMNNKLQRGNTLIASAKSTKKNNNNSSSGRWVTINGNHVFI